MAAPRKKDREQIRAARERQGEAIGRYTTTEGRQSADETPTERLQSADEEPMKDYRVRLPESWWAELKRRGAREGLKPSQVIRQLVAEYLRAR